MDRNSIIEKIQKQAKDGKISCQQAMKVTSEENIPARELGVLLNELKIKVASCQLGCFP